MFRRAGPVLALLVAAIWTVAMPSLALAAQPTHGWFREIPAGDETYDEEELVTRYVPTFLQWVVGDDSRRHLDFIVSVNYDRDRGRVHTWQGRNNWDNAHRLASSAEHLLYGGVVAITENQLYLVYYFFHARDYKFFPSHENDLEGGLLALDRKSRLVIHAQTLAHGRFDERHYCNVANVTRDDERRLVRRWVPRGHRLFRTLEKVGCWEVLLKDLVVWIEGKGHGGHLTSADDVKRVPRNQDWWVKYVHGGSPKTLKYYQNTVLTPTNWPDLKATAFDVKPIWPLFAGMFEDDGSSRRDVTELYAKKLDAPKIKIRGYDYQEIKLGIYRGMQGDDGLFNNSAHFPWGEGSNYWRFLDPVQAIITLESKSQQHPHSRISCDYQFNPYLQTLFNGRFPANLEFEARRDQDFFASRCD